MKGTHEVGRIRDESGQVLCEEEKVRTRWKNYFVTLLESEQTNDAQVPQYGEVPSQANQAAECTDKISVEEVQECIRRLKNRKAPGVCGITGEMLKAGGDAVVQWLHKIFCMAWESGTVPADWRKAQIVPVYREAVEHSVRTTGVLVY